MPAASVVKMSCLGTKTDHFCNLSFQQRQYFQSYVSATSDTKQKFIWHYQIRSPPKAWWPCFSWLKTEQKNSKCFCFHRGMAKFSSAMKTTLQRRNAHTSGQLHLAFILLNARFSAGDRYFRNQNFCYRACAKTNRLCCYCSSPYLLLGC